MLKHARFVLAVFPRSVMQTIAQIADGLRSAKLVALFEASFSLVDSIETTSGPAKSHDISERVGDFALYFVRFAISQPCAAVGVRTRRCGSKALVEHRLRPPVHRHGLESILRMPMPSCLRA